MPVEHRAGGADDGLAGEDAPPARLLPLLRPRQRGRRHPGNNRCLFDRGLVAGEVDAGSNGRGVIQVSNRGPSAYQPNALPLGETGSLRYFRKVNMVLNVHRNHKAY